MNTYIIGLLISGFVSVLTIFGVQFLNFLAKGQENRTKIQGKEFDDGIERRKELIKEIEGYKVTIGEKDKLILASQERIESLKDDINTLTIKYLRLDGQYNDAIEDLAKFSEEMAQKFKEKALEINT